MTFVIDEGPRYTVRNVSFVGHTIFRTEDLQRDLKLEANQFFDQGEMNADVARIQEYYGAHGYIFANIQAEPRFLPEPGSLDLIYAIEEGSRYRVGRVDVTIHGLDGMPPHSKHRTVLNRIDLRPGDIVDVRKLRAAERRLTASGLFLNDPSKGATPRILISPLDDSNAIGRSLDDIQRQAAAGGGRVRSQSPDDAPRAEGVLNIQVNGRVARPSGAGAPPRQAAPSAAGGQPRSLWQPPPRFQSPAPAQAPGFRPLPAPGFQTPPEPRPWRGASQPLKQTPAPWHDRGSVRVRAQSPSGGATANPQPQSRYGGLGARPAPQPTTPIAQAPPPSGYVAPTTPPGVYGGAPPGNFSSPTTQPGVFGGAPPGNSISPMAQPGVGGASIIAPPPLPNAPETLPPPGADPLMPPGGNFNDVWENDPQVILQPDVTETQTGQFSFGVGVNSSAGVMGQIQLVERNFDITRVPNGWNDWGNAFRGGGQQLNISAIPGNQLQRYSATITEPYLFDTPISLSVTGFLFTRFYQNWNEQRIGGNVSLGYQIRPDLSVAMALRRKRQYLQSHAAHTARGGEGGGRQRHLLVKVFDRARHARQRVPGDAGPPGQAVVRAGVWRIQFPPRRRQPAPILPHQAASRRFGKARVELPGRLGSHRYRYAGL